MSAASPGARHGGRFSTPHPNAPVASIAPYLQHVDQVVSAGPYQPDWHAISDYPVPRWYLDGKFGIFIHWGVYAAAAFGNEWYAHAMYRQGSQEFAHHRGRFGSHQTAGYKDYIPLLTANRFDPAAWAELFARAGARFVVPVAEHHDGFAMYDCPFSRWSATRMGPRRDVLGELAQAVRARGLVMGLSSHRAEHYWFLGHGLELPSDVQDAAFADLYGPTVLPPKDLMSLSEAAPPPGFLEDWLARSCDLVERYEPQLVWFDWWIQHDAFKPWLPRFAAFYYNWAAKRGLEVAINAKYGAFPAGSCVHDIERGQLSRAATRFWQNDTSVARNSWGYTEAQDYKQPRDLIHDLVDVVSKNGALLLNVGPRADGSIPEREQEMLLEIGRWLERHGEAIYGTRPWEVSGEGPTAIPDGAFTDTKRQAFTAEDIRYTCAAGVVYAIALAAPVDRRLRLRALGRQAGHVKTSITSVALVGGGMATWRQADDALEVALPALDIAAPTVCLRIAIAA